MDTSLRRVIEVYVFVYSFFIASRPLSDGDFWWHLKTGEYIFSHHSVPRVDIYSFTNLGKPWIAHEWLSELFFYLVYSHFGFNALIFIFAVLTATSFWLVFKQIDAHPFLAGFSTLLGGLAVLPTIGVRPRVFSLLFASLYLLILNHYANDGRGKKIFFLIPMLAVWVNLHAGYLIGLVLIGLVLFGIVLDGWLSRDGVLTQWARIKNLILVLFGCLVAVNLNPQGPRIYLFPFEFFFSPIQQQEVNDWLSPNFHQPELMPLALLILLSIAAITLSPRRIKPSELLLFLSTLYATLKSNRHMAIFALVAAPLVANYGQIWLGTTSFGKSFSPGTVTQGNRRAIVFGILFLIPVFAFAYRLKTVTYAPPQQELVAVPLKAVEYMKQNQITGNTFTDPNIWSGYLIWAMPSNPVYIDGRIDMYGDDFVSDYVKITSGVKDWHEPFNRYGTKVALVSSTSVLRAQLETSNDWDRRYADEMAVVYVSK